MQAIEPWHLNTEYPISLELDVPEGIDMTRWTFDRQAASTLENEAVEFELEYVAASPGEKHFEGQFNYAVCVAQACVAKKMDVVFSVDVKPKPCSTGLC